MRMIPVWATMLFLVAAGSPTGVRAQGAEPIEIPLRVEDGRLIVPVEASDGAQLQFIVGTSYTVLSESGAARLASEFNRPSPWEEWRFAPMRCLRSRTRNSPSLGRSWTEWWARRRSISSTC